MRDGALIAISPYLNDIVDGQLLDGPGRRKAALRRADKAPGKDEIAWHCLQRCGFGAIVRRASLGKVEEFPMNPTLLAAILALSVMPAYAQGQPNAAKLKADAQNVVTIISSDKAKMQTYCQFADLNDEIDQANQNQDTKKVQELSLKADELEKKLGPEFSALVDDLKDVNPGSQDGQEIGSILDKLDEFCGD